MVFCVTPFTEQDIIEVYPHCSMDKKFIHLTI